MRGLIFFLGPRREGKRRNSEPFGDTLMLEINKVGKHWHLRENEGGSGSRKRGPVSGARKQRFHMAGWIVR